MKQFLFNESEIDSNTSEDNIGSNIIDNIINVNRNRSHHNMDNYNYNSNCKPYDELINNAVTISANSTNSTNSTNVVDKSKNNNYNDNYNNNYNNKKYNQNMFYIDPDTIMDSIDDDIYSISAVKPSYIFSENIKKQTKNKENKENKENKTNKRSIKFKFVN